MMLNVRYGWTYINIIDHKKFLIQIYFNMVYLPQWKIVNGKVKCQTMAFIARKNQQL